MAMATAIRSAVTQHCNNAWPTGWGAILAHPVRTHPRRNLLRSPGCAGADDDEAGVSRPNCWDVGSSRPFWKALSSSPLVSKTVAAPAGPLGHLPMLFNIRQKALPFSDEKITQTAGRRHHPFHGRTDYEPLPDLRQTYDIENCQSAIANLRRDRVCRNKRDSQTRHHCLFDRLI